MTVKTTEAQREMFWARHEAGETCQEIADVYGLSRGCVRYWCRRQRDGGSCRTRFRRQPRGLLCSFDPLVRYVLLRLRLAHPRWGPNRLRYHLGRRPSLRGKRLPSETQIGRYLRQWPKLRRKRKRQRPKKRPDPPKRVHQRWQVDFKLGIPLAEENQVNLHTVREVIGAVCLTAAITPAGPVGRKATRVTLAELQTTLRAAFIRWGTLPEEIQTDGEAVFVGRPGGTFPSKFTLWLAGLGIGHLVIRRGRPTDNAEVERCHRTINEYTVIGHQHLPAAQLQAVLDQAVEELAFELPSRAHGCHGQPPVQAHPALLDRPRPYQAQQELALFDLDRVDAFLADFTWKRKVGKTGQICIGGQHQYYSVGRAFARRSVLVRFDPADRHFVFSDEEQPDKELGRKPARGFEVEDIVGLITHDAAHIPQQLPLPLVLEGVNC